MSKQNVLPVQISKLRNLTRTEAEIRALIVSRIGQKNEMLSHPDGTRNGPRNASARLKIEGALEQLASILDYMDGV